MRGLKRGLQGIKTVSGLADRRGIRTASGALRELSVLANEKKRLEMEMERWRRRQIEVDARLAEIADKERRLYEFVEKPPADAPVALAATNNGPRLRPTQLLY